MFQSKKKKISNHYNTTLIQLCNKYWNAKNLDTGNRA